MLLASVTYQLSFYCAQVVQKNKFTFDYNPFERSQLSVLRKNKTLFAFFVFVNL